ncbi:MAG: hypothetical protein IPO60_07915 [Flavobacteriales bacterium]|nr:hypothetical protein [Flavobacteriales bacterium]MBK7286878.1 hypothetical protein [Flavobacteriales bacterium]MBK9598243.1 hypothetical protein [Flavobacteriales bacterium]HQY78208.1 hypothetical protein [Flavobacteriales bacterium]
MIEQVLDSPVGRDVRRAPITLVILLHDPESAGQLAQFLDSKGRRCDNALAVLNLYDEKCLPALLGACAALGVGGRSRVLNVLYSLLQDLPQARIKEQLSTYRDALLVLLTDKRPIVLDYRGPVEIDFAGRLCDDAYIIIQVLLIPDADVSEFRRASEEERDRFIDQLLRKLGSTLIG